MCPKVEQILQDKLNGDNYEKLMCLNNPKLHQFVVQAVELCNPDSVFVCTDSEEDIAHIRRQAVENNEETPLAIDGHTIHFDGFSDQGRDKKATKYLVPKDIELGSNLNSIDRDQGFSEIHKLMKGIMQGRVMYVRFFCLGPRNSQFSISCVQLTDSAYVAHSEDLLYRPGYQQFKQLGGDEGFFRFLHSAGRLENNVSADVANRRMYIDIAEDMVYSVNTQYGGNTIGLKKLALRLAIRKADREGWLAEHMFILGVGGPGDRVTYFAGAFPSACGKTSTAMLPGETIVGDDIAYFRIIDNQMRTVNVESGIFGIIRDVCPQDDPLIYQVLTSPGEAIFSNVLIKDGRPCWLGMGCDLPEEGVNHSGKWLAGKKDKDGNEITASHKNARYTIALKNLANLDQRANDPNGVPVGGIIYGGRDSDTSVPVQQSFDWAHGIITMGASLESETTAATLGAEGVRAFNLMSNLDFLAIPLGRYINNNLQFIKGLENPPLVFAVNYFLKDADGEYLNGMLDKGVWMKWMELRAHGDLDAIDTPTGMIPRYEDLNKLFKQVLNKPYSQEQYVQQFTLRVEENLKKLARIENVYRKDVSDAPAILFDLLGQQRDRLEKLGQKHGKYVSPLVLQG